MAGSTGRQDPPSATTRLVVVEDEPLFRDLLRHALEASGTLDAGEEDASGPVEVVGTFDRGEGAIEGIAALRPDVALLDIHLAGEMTGVELGVRLREVLPGVGIVLLSATNDVTVLTSLPDEVVGGWSYLLKSSVADLAVLRRAIRGARDGHVVLDPELVGALPERAAGPVESLTARQRELLALMAEGYSNAAIAEELFLAEKSVENHLSRIYHALGIHSVDPQAHPRVQAVLAYLRSTLPPATAQA
jgi:DNA-binding NarL/FixJ family response regulator